MIDRSRSVVVVGAGIAGLTAALSFAKAGFTVEIFERALRLQEAGAGVQLSPNALRVLERLGLGEAARTAGVEADCVTLRAARSGRRIVRVPVRSRDGRPYLSIHRGDLQSALLRAVENTSGIRLHLGCELIRCGVGDDTTGLVFDRSGQRLVRTAPIVIGADGVRSKLAAEVGCAEPDQASAIAWRMTGDMSAMRGGAPVPSGIEAWLGRRRHAIAYPLRHGSQVNLVLIEPPAGDGKADLLKSFGRWDPRLLAMIERCGPPVAWPLMTVGDDRRWVHGNSLLLIGDAAHAMLPFAAQGAAMAIEDAFVAAFAFATARSRRRALETYVRARKERVERVRRRVGFHRFVYHLPFPLSLGRDAVLAARSPQALRRDLAWLYDWTPPAL